MLTVVLPAIPVKLELSLNQPALSLVLDSYYLALEFNVSVH